MELRRGPRAARRECALSIGNFDGLHLGHQALLRRVRGCGAESGEVVN